MACLEPLNHSTPTPWPKFWPGSLRPRKRDRRSTDSYRIMESSDSVNGVMRWLSHACKTAVLDAYDVLHTKFGFEHSHELYDHLHQIPARAHLYEKAFNAETHVGCVDGPWPTSPKKPTSHPCAGWQGRPHRQRCSLNALTLATNPDEALHIQRLSVDVPTIAARLTARERPVGVLAA